MLRREYLNQTVNFLPEIIETYNERSLNLKYETYQEQILQKKTYTDKGKWFLLHFLFDFCYIRRVLIL